MTNQMLPQRLARWIRASHSLGHIDHWISPVLQGVGKLDVSLLSQAPVIEENIKRQQKIPPEVSDADIAQFDAYVYQNFLWVLAAYEFARTLDQIYRDGKAIDVARKKSINTFKRQIERVRIPLAKLETADRFPNDSRIAFPGWQPGKGVGWMVDQTNPILRVDLSDGLLSALEAQ